MSDRQDVLLAIQESLDLLLRLKIQEVRSTRSQADMIQFLGETGCGPAKIAALLGTSVNNVKPVLYGRAKKSKAKRKTK